MNILMTIAAALAAVVVAAAIFGVVTMLAWNAVMPSTFGLPAIDFVQGFALNLLGGALFKSTHVTRSA